MSSSSEEPSSPLPSLSSAPSSAPSSSSSSSGVDEDGGWYPPLDANLYSLDEEEEKLRKEKERKGVVGEMKVMDVVGAPVPHVDEYDVELRDKKVHITFFVHESAVQPPVVELKPGEKRKINIEGYLSMRQIQPQLLDLLSAFQDRSSDSRKSSHRQILVGKYGEVTLLATQNQLQALKRRKALPPQAGQASLYHVGAICDLLRDCRLPQRAAQLRKLWREMCIDHQWIDVGTNPEGREPEPWRKQRKTRTKRKESDDESEEDHGSVSSTSPSPKRRRNSPQLQMLANQAEHHQPLQIQPADVAAAAAAASQYEPPVPLIPQDVPGVITLLISSAMKIGEEGKAEETQDECKQSNNDQAGEHHQKH